MEPVPNTDQQLAPPQAHAFSTEILQQASLLQTLGPTTAIKGYNGLHSPKTKMHQNNAELVLHGSIVGVIYVAYIYMLSGSTQREREEWNLSRKGLELQTRVQLKNTKLATQAAEETGTA